MPRPRPVEVEPLAEDPERDVVDPMNEVIKLKSSTDQPGTERGLVLFDPELVDCPIPDNHTNLGRTELFMAG